MQKTFTLHIKQENKTKFVSRMDRPYFTHYPILGVPYLVAGSKDCSISVQEIGLQGNGLHLIETLVEKEVELEINLLKPTIFFVMMIEGSYKQFKDEGKSLYAMGGTFFMIYCPEKKISVHLSQGKHSAMLLSIEPELLYMMTSNRPYLIELAHCLLENKNEIVPLPMVQIDKSISHLMQSMRLSSFYPVTGKMEMRQLLTIFVENYGQRLIENNPTIKQLSLRMTKQIYKFVSQHLEEEIEPTAQQIADHVNLPESKIIEYSTLIFGKSLHKHLLTIRLLKAAGLLKFTFEPITTIGQKTGFTNEFQFYRFFKDFYGMAPKSFRDHYFKLKKS